MRVEPQHHWVAGIEIRPNLCTEVGDLIRWHVHDFPHMTMVTRGKWLMRRRRLPDCLLASAGLSAGHFPDWVEIPAGVEHEFEVLETERGVAALTCLWAGGIK